MVISDNFCSNVCCLKRRAQIIFGSEATGIGMEAGCGCADILIVIPTFTRAADGKPGAGNTGAAAGYGARVIGADDPLGQHVAVRRCPASCSCPEHRSIRQSGP